MFPTVKEKSQDTKENPQDVQESEHIGDDHSCSEKTETIGYIEEALNKLYSIFLGKWFITPTETYLQNVCKKDEASKESIEEASKQSIENESTKPDVCEKDSLEDPLDS